MLPFFAFCFCKAVCTFFGLGPSFAFQMFCFVFYRTNERVIGCGMVRRVNKPFLFLVVLDLKVEVCCFGLQIDL